MAQKQKQSRKKQKPDYRRLVVGGLALLMAVLMLLPMLAMLVGGAGAVTQAEIDALKNEQSGYQSKMSELKDKLNDLKDDQAQAEEKRRVLEAQLNAINGEIENIDRQIALYDSQIAQYNAQIEQKEAERLEAVAREQAQYELFCQRVRAMEKDGDVSYWSILFKAEDFSDLLDRAMLISDVMDYDNAVMDQLVATRREIEQIKTELETARAEQEAARAEQQAVREQQAARRQEQAAKVKEAQALVAKINADAAEVNSQLEAESKAAKEIQAELVRKQREMEAQRRQNNVVFETGSGYHWPLPGRYKLTSKFGYRIHPIQGTPSSHTGTDIPAPSGTPIEACKGGQVITSTYHSSYGNYVVVDHGGGNSTLYAHMSSRSVSVGDIVTQGQVLGKVGSTGSSTGPHLHLEVRVNYQRVDAETCFPSLPFDRAYNR